MTFPALEALVIQVIRRHKARLLSGEQAAMQQMTARWYQVEVSLAGRLEALAIEAAELRAAGKPVTLGIVYRMRRYKDLIGQAKEETGRYTAFAERQIAERQAELITAGITDGVEAIGAAYADGARVAVTFNRLPVAALENLVGLAGDGSPLRKHLAKIYPDAVEGMLDALIEGMAQGLHPLEVARRMRTGLGVGLQTSLRTARTETLRAYREATLAQYRESGVVAGYTRVSARDSRVCLGCLLADDGTVYPLDRAFDEHVQGRCVAVPQLIDVPMRAWQTGPEWLRAQPEARQREIMGAGRYNAWKKGVPLERMVEYKFDETWGGAFVPAPVGSLTV